MASQTLRYDYTNFNNKIYFHQFGKHLILSTFLELRLRLFVILMKASPFLKE